MILDSAAQHAADLLDAVDKIAYVVSAIGTLAAVAASVWAAITARNDARQANARVLQLQTELDLQRRREGADARAAELAERGASEVYVSTSWTSLDHADQNSFGFSWFVSTRGKEQVRVVAAQTEFPFVRHSSDHTPRDLLLEAGGEYQTNPVMVPTEHHAMASFAHDPKISQPPPVEIEFIDPLDNRWHLSTDRTLTLLTPRTIAAAPDDRSTSER